MTYNVVCDILCRDLRISEGNLVNVHVAGIIAILLQLCVVALLWSVSILNPLKLIIVTTHSERLVGDLGSPWY